MPTIKETELEGQEGIPCTNCPDYEGAIFLCGEGYLCERCFAQLADIDEDELFAEDVPLDEFRVPDEQKAKVKASLTLLRGGEDGDEA